MITKRDALDVFPEAIEVPDGMVPPSPILVLDFVTMQEPIGTRYAKPPIPKLRRKLRLDSRTGQRRPR